MGTENRMPVGSVMWRDLTVENAGEIRDFYCNVVGWTASPHNVGDYDDFNIHSPESNEVVAGICHAWGENARIPPQWLIYIVVEDVAESARRCLKLGGAVLDGPRRMGGQGFCVIRDPAGAVAALIDQGDSGEGEG
jgi:predicted enzyme related to lactoylglutathione lyase